MKHLAIPAVIVALLLVLLAQLGSDARAQVGLTRRAPWPPLPENMVAWEGLTNHQQPPNSTFTFFYIPTEKWFVMTSVKIEGPGSDRLFVEAEPANSQAVLVNTQAMLGDGVEGPLGIPCLPNRHLRLVNQTDQPQQVTRVLVRGYFVDTGL